MFGASHRGGPVSPLKRVSEAAEAALRRGARGQGRPSFFGTVQLHLGRRRSRDGAVTRRGSFPPRNPHTACKSSRLLRSTCPGRNRGKSSGLYSGCTCPRHRGRILFCLSRGPYHPHGTSHSPLRCTCPRHSRCKQKILVRCTCPQHRARILLGRFRGGYRANKRYRSRNHNFRRIF